MVRLAEIALSEGALGVSLGLEYAPGTTLEEVLPLAHLAAGYDKLMPIHTRTDAFDFAKGVHEAIKIMELTGVRVQISHFAYQYAMRGVMRYALHMVEEARAKGLPLFCDTGAYEAYATFIGSPVFAPGWEERSGCTLHDLMVSSGKYAGMHCTPEILAEIQETAPTTIGTAFVCNHSEVILALQQPYCMISTDGGISLARAPRENHPEGAGTYPRILGRFVREENALPLLDAITKASWLPAQQLGLGNKGWLGEGADADIVVFDPNTIIDNAEYVGLGEPDAPPTGIEEVIVNGKSCCPFIGVNSRK